MGCLGMSTEKSWKEHMGKPLVASRGSLCFELTGLYFENYALFDKRGAKEKSCPALLSHMVIINSEQLSTYQDTQVWTYVKLHPEQKTWWRWRLGTWRVMTPSLVITGGVLLAWYPGVPYSDENALERYGMV